MFQELKAELTHLRRRYEKSNGGETSSAGIATTTMSHSSRASSVTSLEAPGPLGASDAISAGRSGDDSSINRDLAASPTASTTVDDHVLR